MPKRIFSGSVLLAALWLITGKVSANQDTLKVLSHQRTHMNWYGAFKKTDFFPSGGKSYAKVVMHYTLGCPDKGCSEWDYTTQVFVNHKTGGTDSTLRTRSSLFVGELAVSSFSAALNPVYDTILTQPPTAVMQQSLTLNFFNDSLKPTQRTDSLRVWNAHWRYYFDENLVVIDSVKVIADTLFTAQTWRYYTYMPAIQKFEIGRLITPYAGGFSKDWKWNYVFDVTDFQTLLQDSVEIELFYSGYQDGFTASIQFDFIEGTPGRKVHSIQPVYLGSFPYGDPNNSIENYLNAKRIKYPSEAQSARFKVIQTGHGFGGNENCAEFCPKNHFVKVNGSTRYTTLVWKEDCGNNPLYPQPGTWLYNRSNWCPGESITPYDYELGEWIAPGDSFNLDLDMEPFTNVGNNFCTYILSGVLVFYETAKPITDIAIIEIVSPNVDMRFSRTNPSCYDPVVRVQNLGQQEVYSIEFEYGVKGGIKKKTTWKGSIKSGETQDCVLWMPDWTGAQNQGVFECTVLKVNNYDSDYVSANNSLSSRFNLAPVLPSRFFVQLRTNNAPSENRIVVKNNDGKIYLDKTYSQANFLHRDTLNLPLGCYELKLTDAGNNGLSFWANQAAGTGSFQLRNLSSQLIQNFNADFGTSITYYFTVTHPMSASSADPFQHLFEAYPNPANELLTLSIPANQKITDLKMIGIDGRTWNPIIVNQEADKWQFDVSQLPLGVYIVRFSTEKGPHSIKIVVSHTD